MHQISNIAFILISLGSLYSAENNRIETIEDGKVAAVEYKYKNLEFKTMRKEIYKNDVKWDDIIMVKSPLVYIAGGKKFGISAITNGDYDVGYSFSANSEIIGVQIFQKTPRKLIQAFEISGGYLVEMSEEKIRTEEEKAKKLYEIYVNP